MIKEEMKSVKIYALDAHLVDSNTGKKVEDEDEVKNIEFGTMKELNDKISQYESSWNTDRKDGTVWKFTKRYVKNENRNESLEEDVKDLPTEVEIEYASLDADVLEYYDLEEAIKMYLQEFYDAKVTDFSYYWYDVNTILVHDIKWSSEKDLHEDKLLEYTTYWFGEREYPSKKVDHGEYDPHTGEFADGTTLDDLEDWELEETIDNSKVKVYNNTEAKSMNKEKELKEEVVTFHGNKMTKSDFENYCANLILKNMPVRKLTKDDVDNWEW